MYSGVPLGLDVVSLSLLSVSTQKGTECSADHTRTARLKVLSTLGGRATHRQFQWMKLEHIPEALQVIYQSINLLSH